MPSQDHKQLMQTLNKLVKQERWAKVPKKKGQVLEKSFTKSGNLKFVVGNEKKNLTFFVLKRNKNLFETASKADKGDEVSVALRTQLGKQYCVKFTRKNKEKKLSEWG